MKAAVITPYYKESIQTLWRCHQSVLSQESDCRHFLVADGFPNDSIWEWDCEHLTLPAAHNDNGNTPRSIGALSAINRGYEVIFFLDADNWYTGDHVSEALKMKEENPKIDVAVLRRQIVLPDGTMVPDDQEDIAKSHVDTSCYAFFESSFSLIPFWGMMPTFLSPMCDRFMFIAIKAKHFSLAWSAKKTVFFASNYRAHYINAGRVPPSKTNDVNMQELVSRLMQDPGSLKVRTGLEIFLPQA